MEVFEKSIAWRSPSNIAIVKYWGKKENQIPTNPSISFTLNNCYSETEINFLSGNGDIKFLFEGKDKPGFAKRIKEYFGILKEYLPWIDSYNYKIYSSNSFPHSSGIASSASSMSAIVMCLCDFESQFVTNQNSEKDLLRRASFLSRLGSGSACRSVYPKVALWGEESSFSRSSNLYAIGIQDEMHENFEGFQDAILITSSTEKEVSSSLGHQLMAENPFSSTRYQIANKNIERLIQILKEGDLHAFGEILEMEAMQLHALMMCSKPAFILMHPRTLEVIQSIKSFRKETGLPVYFTLDAGPNVHVMYPLEIKEKIEKFIESKLVSYCEDGRWIADHMGSGPIKIK